jgi:glycine/D-amino acid oxidase-like deaminating enzyme
MSSFATNAYGKDLWPRLKQTVIAPNSYQIATAPPSDNVRKSILPFGQVSSDARRLLVYFRLDDQGRLLVGGRGPLREPQGDGDWAHLEAMLPRLFPRLKALRLPLTPVRPLPLYGLHNALAAAFIAWYRFLDRHGVA